MRNYEEVLIGRNNQENLICDFLKKKCNEIPEFKNDVETYEQKSVPGMMKYIISQAQKLEQDGCGWSMVEDSTVYNWAFDYFHDKDIKEAEHPAEIENNEATVASKPQPKENKPEETHHETFEPINLFEVMGNEY